MTTRYAVLNVSTDTFIKKGQFAGHLYRREKRARRDAEKESHFKTVEVEI